MSEELDKPSEIQSFSDDLDKLVHRYNEEFDISGAAMLGVLEFKQWQIAREFDETWNKRDGGSNE